MKENSVVDLLLDLSKRNKVFDDLRLSSDPNHPCDNVVNSQLTLELEPTQFHLPEPWNGRIDCAPILFISSNPSISVEELFPTSGWPDEMIVDFFMNRFEDRGVNDSWVYKNKILMRDGSRSKRTVAYWAAIQCRAAELFGRDVIPGIDYCITEIVPFKSHKEIGVARAAKFCNENYFSKVVKLSDAAIFIGVGKVAMNFLKSFYPEDKIGEREILYIPHPNARSRKTFASHYSSEKLASINSLLKQSSIIETVYKLENTPPMMEIQRFITSKIKLKTN